MVGGNHCRVTSTWVPMATQCCSGLGGLGHCQLQAEPAPCSLLDMSAWARGSRSPSWGDESLGTCRLSPLFLCEPAVLLEQHPGKARPRPSAVPSSVPRLLDPTGSCLPCGKRRGCVPALVKALVGLPGCPWVRVGFFLTPKQGPKPCPQPRAGGRGSVPACLPHAACRRG